MDFQVIHPKIVGLDVHSKVIAACYLETPETGDCFHELAEFSAFKKGLNQLADWIKEHDCPVVIMESTGIYWKRPRNILFKSGIKSLVVNARHVKNVPGHKTDMADAQWLALIGRAGLVRDSFVPTPEFEKLRQIARLRQQTNGELGRTKNRMHKALYEAGILLGNVVSDVQGVAARKMIEIIIKGGSPEEALKAASKNFKASKEELLMSLEAEPTEKDRYVLRELLDSVKHLEKKVEGFDKTIQEGLSPYQEIIELLVTIPGVDKLAAALILVETGVDMNVFKTADRLASWAGMCPGNHESAGKRKTTHTLKGSRWLRRILTEVANAAIKTKGCYFQAKYRNLVVRRGHKRSVVAIGHNIIRIIFYMIRDKEVYRDRVVDYNEMVVRKNAPRWLKQLSRLGYISEAD
jgi:transposase